MWRSKEPCPRPWAMVRTEGSPGGVNSLIYAGETQRLPDTNVLVCWLNRLTSCPFWSSRVEPHSRPFAGTPLPET
jgi:hypothetical protein